MILRVSLETDESEPAEPTGQLECHGTTRTNRHRRTKPHVSASVGMRPHFWIFDCVLYGWCVMRECRFFSTACPRSATTTGAFYPAVGAASLAQQYTGVVRGGRQLRITPHSYMASEQANAHRGQRSDQVMRITCGWLPCVVPDVLQVARASPRLVVFSPRETTPRRRFGCSWVASPAKPS